MADLDSFVWRLDHDKHTEQVIARFMSVDDDDWTLSIAFSLPVLGKFMEALLAEAKACADRG